MIVSSPRLVATACASPIRLQRRARRVVDREVWPVLIWEPGVAVSSYHGPDHITGIAQGPDRGGSPVGINQDEGDGQHTADVTELMQEDVPAGGSARQHNSVEESRV